MTAKREGCAIDDCGDYFLGNQFGADAGKSFDLMLIHANIEAVKTFLTKRKRSQGGSMTCRRAPRCSIEERQGYALMR
jgi:hypothetical protein